MIEQQHSEEYRRVIASLEWRKMRAERVRTAKQKCERCGRWPTYTRDLELHHRTYERLGHERPEDVELLCKPCHATADQERAKDSKRRAGERLWEAQVDGWAAKVYGEEALPYLNWGDVEEEFKEWLERKGD